MDGLGVLLQGFGGGMGGLGDLDPNQITSPSRDQLRSETDKLLAAIKQLGADEFASDASNVSAAELASWNAFVAEVTSWDSGPDAIIHFLGTTWRDELVNYQTKFNEFADAFRGSGVSSSTSDFTFVPAPPSTLDRLIGKATSPVTDTLSTIKWVGIAAGVAVVGFMAYLTFETGRTARSIGPRLITGNPRRRRRRRR